MFVFVVGVAFTFSLNTTKADDNNEKNTKVKIMNSQVDTNTSEVIVRIKNNNFKGHKVKKSNADR